METTDTDQGRDNRTKINGGNASRRKKCCSRHMGTILAVFFLMCNTLIFHKMATKTYSEIDSLVMNDIENNPAEIEESIRATQITVSNKTTVRGIEDIDVLGIIKKWELVSKKARALLLEQYEKEFDYDSDRDFIYFHHLLKTGGTSVSEMMEKVFGDAVLPGSLESGYFKSHLATDAIKAQNGTDYKVSYSHSHLRPLKGKRSPVSTFLMKYIAPKRKIRLITMLRDPLDLRASRHAMSQCGLNLLVEEHNRRRVKKGLTPQCGLELNLTALVGTKLTRGLSNECSKKLKVGKLSLRKARECESLEKGLDPFEHCRSASNVLNSTFYKGMGNLKGVMGRYVKYDKHESSANVTASPQLVAQTEEHAMQDLGGLLPNVQTSKNELDEFDIFWFGITERMAESMCLFYYMVRITAPLEETPTRRFKKCRPNSWWTQEDRDEVRRREPLDYALWRAANAVLDVRLVKMRHEIQAKLGAGMALEDIPYVGPGCF